MPNEEKTAQQLLEEQKAEFQKQLEELTAKHNSEMASLRKKNTEEKQQAIENAKKEATMSAEELAKEETQKQLKEKDERIATLEKEAQASRIKSALSSKKLPEFLKNDQRLTSTKSQEELDGAIKEVEEDYKKSLINSNTSSTNFNEATESKSDSKKSELEEMMAIR